jgi:putative radical SAM enzyme (TIGR03279 family)
MEGDAAGARRPRSRYRRAPHGGLPVATAEGAARRAGLRPGDCIVRLNGGIPADVLDLEMAAADGSLWLTVLRDGHPLDLTMELNAGQWHGISLGHGGLGAEPRVCRNRCRFCFVDQVPPGLRAALYVKDDDYRLSFLHGNFITLTNLQEADLARIEGLRLSPLYVSLHAWDDEARVRLMGRRASGSRAALEELAAAGLELHLQVVLCPGWNDGEVLAETVERVAALDSVADLGIVPVSLAAEGDLRRVTPADATKVVSEVGSWQARFAEVRGRAFVHAADEFHLLCGRIPPPGDAPEQYENGIGMAAVLLDEADELAVAASRTAAGLPAAGLRLLCGALAEPVIARVAERLAVPLGVSVRPFVVRNRLFGPHVTVTGLLGGAEVLAALRDEPLAAGEYLVAPRVFLPAEIGRTLDDVGEEELAALCGGRLIVAESLHDAFATLSS